MPELTWPISSPSKTQYRRNLSRKIFNRNFKRRGGLSHRKSPTRKHYRYWKAKRFEHGAPARLLPYCMLLKIKWRGRTYGLRKKKAGSPRIRIGHLEQFHEWKKSMTRYCEQIQTVIPTHDVDGRYQLTPFYGWDKEPHAHTWWLTITEKYRTILGHSYYNNEELAKQFEDCGVELRLNPYRVAFRRESDATFFLLRWA